MAETAVTDDGLGALTGLRKLRQLNLKETLVTGRGFAAYAERKYPRKIRLEGAPVNDEGMEQIAGMTSLASLCAPTGHCTILDRSKTQEWLDENVR